MKLRYAICGCNSKKSARIFRLQFVAFLRYAFYLLLVFQVLSTLSTLIIMKPFPIFPKEYLNETFYQDCFKDPEFTAETHRLLHEKCIQLRNESFWITYIPIGTVKNVTLMLEPYNELKAYLDSQQKRFNLTECFMELRENYIGLFESRKPYSLVLLGSVIIITVLSVLSGLLIIIKSRDFYDCICEYKLFVHNVGCGCYTFSLIGLTFTIFTVYEINYNIDLLKTQDLYYFLHMC